MTEVAGAAATRLDGVRVLVLFGGSHLFGQERANIEAMRAVRSCGAEVRFVINRRFGREHIQPELDRRGFGWITAPFGYHWSRHMLGRHFVYFLLNLYGVAATSWVVSRIVRTWKPTHLYAMNWSFFLFSLPALAMSKLPFVYRAGDTLPEHTTFHRWIARKLRQRVTSLICNSQFVARSFSRLGFRPIVIYNHPPDRGGLARDCGLAEKLPVKKNPAMVRLIYAGQIAEHKGVTLLIKVVVEMIRDRNNWELWVAGESVWGDPLRQELERSVRDAGMTEHIRFLGAVENIPELLRNADIHVCPSLWDEPSPNVIMEAKREGIPSVAFRRGGIPELIEHRIDGYLCSDATSEGLTEGLKYFADDAVKRRDAGSAARKSYETNFGFSRFQREWAEVFVSR